MCGRPVHRYLIYFQWDLICDDYSPVSLMHTAGVTGFLTGCIVFGHLSDKYVMFTSNNNEIRSDLYCLIIIESDQGIYHHQQRKVKFSQLAVMIWSTCTMVLHMIRS